MCTYITIYFLWVSLMTEKVGLIGCGVKWRSVQTRQGFAVLTFRHLHLDSPTYLSSAVLREKFLGWAWLGLFQVSAFYSVGTVWELVVRFSFSTSAALWESKDENTTRALSCSFPLTDKSWTSAAGLLSVLHCLGSLNILHKALDRERNT